MTAPPFRPRGIWGAVLLPLDRAGEIDMVALADTVDILCAGSLAGIYTNGTASEFHSQTEAEFDTVTALVADRAGRAGKPFQIGVSNSNARVARARLARIRDCGAVAAQVTLPDWWPPSADERARFMAGMDSAADGLPLILYNPPHAKVRLDVAQIAALRPAAPGLAGAKTAGGDTAWYAARRAQLGDLSVFVPGHSVAFGRPLGADGFLFQRRLPVARRRGVALEPDRHESRPGRRSGGAVRAFPAHHAAAAGAGPRPVRRGAGQADGGRRRLGSGRPGADVALFGCHARDGAGRPSGRRTPRARTCRRQPVLTTGQSR